MSGVKEGLYYTKKHEWLKPEEGGQASIGITDYAQNSLGDIVYVDASPIDTEFDAEESIGAIESVKAAEDIYAPVAGQVTEVNEELKDAPEKINQEPYSAWILKIKGYDEGELSNLMDSKAYESYLAGLEE